MKLMKYTIYGVRDEDGNLWHTLNVQILEEPVWQWKTVAPVIRKRMSKLYETVQAYIEKGYTVMEEQSSGDIEQLHFGAKVYEGEF